MRIGLACEAQVPAELLDLLEAAGLPAGPLRGQTPPALVPASALAASATPEPASTPAEGVSWLLAADLDVLRACDRGGLDLGVVGKDALLEARRGVSELLDLKCCRDELVYATARVRRRPDSRLRVATRHPLAARRHFAASGRQPELLGFAEPALAPALGLADGIVELASRLDALPELADRLEVRERVAECSARLVAGRAARALLGPRLSDLVERLRTLVEGR